MIDPHSGPCRVLGLLVGDLWLRGRLFFREIEPGTDAGALPVWVVRAWEEDRAGSILWEHEERDQWGNQAAQRAIDAVVARMGGIEGVRSLLPRWMGTAPEEKPRRRSPRRRG